VSEQSSIQGVAKIGGRWTEPIAFIFIALVMSGRLRMEGADPWTFAVAGVGLAGLLWGRRRDRLIGGTIALTAAIVGVALESSVDPATGFLAAAAIYLVTVRGERNRARWLAAALAAVFLVALLIIEDLTFGEFVRNMAPLLLGFATGEAIWYRRAVLAEAQERAHLAEVTRDEEARLRVQEERIRIARELHDIVGHSLSIINVQAGAAGHVIAEQPEVAKMALEEIREVSHGALQELRATVGVLRTGLEDRSGLAPTPQLRDLDALIASFRDAGLAVDIHSSEETPDLGAAQQLAVYRIVQEALTNVVRHSGRSQAGVSIVYPPGEVSVEVVNDGEVVETSDAGDGLGLVGMRERIVALGGTVEARPRLDGGFRVRARFPVWRS
jgi:signal transduction histidine kinase